MSARCAKALIEGGPQRIFGYFLCEQKVTPAPLPAGQNLLNKKSGSAAERHSHKNLTYGRGGEAKLPTKFFAKLSFKKAGTKLF